MSKHNYKCTRCGCQRFYQEAAYVYCIKCNGLYSSPSGRELKDMMQKDIFSTKSVLLDHYELMPLFEEFIRD